MVAKKIHWLFPRECSLADIKISHLASMRLRAGVAGSAIEGLGGVVSFGECLPRQLDYLIVPKIGSDDITNRSKKWIALIDEVKSKSTKIVIDYTDNHLGFDSPMTDFYSEVLTRADIFVVPSISMQNNLPSSVRYSSLVIPDAVEYALVKPRPTKNLMPVLLWFGHPSNLPFLFEFTQRFSLKNYCELMISTHSEGLDWIKKNHANLNLPKTKLIPWSIAGLPEIAMHADLALLPAGVADIRKSGASANRLLTSLALGLPVLAQSLISYAEFREYYTDIDKDNIHTVIRAPSSQHSKVLDAQYRILPRFLDESLGAQWVSLFRSWK